MEKILQDLNTCLDQARTLINEYKQRIDQVKSQKDLLDRDREAVEAKIQELNDREFNVKHVENVDTLHKDAIARHDAANLAVNASAKAESDFRQYKAQVEAELTEKRLQEKKKAKINEKRAADIEAEVTKRVQDVLKSVGVSK